MGKARRNILRRSSEEMELDLLTGMRGRLQRARVFLL